MDRPGVSLSPSWGFFLTGDGDGDEGGGGKGEGGGSSGIGQRHADMTLTASTTPPDEDRTIYGFHRKSLRRREIYRKPRRDSEIFTRAHVCFSRNTYPIMKRDRISTRLFSSRIRLNGSLLLREVCFLRIKPRFHRARTIKIVFPRFNRQ